jgi:methylase of polypeptide subunit release factors
VNRFLRRLEQSGYRQFYLAFGDANFRKQDWTLGARGLASPLSELVKLFLLQESVARKKVLRFLQPELIEELLACGVLCEQGANLKSNSFFLIFCRAHALFCQMVVHPLAYFGDDSLALAALQTPAPGGNVLDLCCGTGIQSFVAAGYASKVTGVEIQRETWRIAELNRRLNNLGQRVRFVCDSAEQFARTSKETYDRILFNPPLVPMLPGYKFPLAGNGGPDGLAVTRRIIPLYSRRLSVQGTFEFIGTGLGKQNHPSVCHQIQALARRHGLGGRIHLLSQHPIRPFAPVFESSVAVLASNNNMDPAEAREKLLAHFKTLGHDAYWMFFTSLGRTAGARNKELSIINLTKSFWGAWFV